jgi:hypothetical protein
MPGGKGQIRPSDNKKPFTKNYNGSNFVKWTEKKVHSILDELEEWLFEEIELFDEKGVLLGKTDKGNCFYLDFLYKKKLYNSWISYVKDKYTTVSYRMEDFDKIQEHKLQLLAAKGAQKEGITKFILTNKYNWVDKAENKTEHSGSVENRVIKVNFKKPID